MADAPKTAPVKGQMLPGLAGICMFLMLMTMLNAYGALTGVFGPGIIKYGILALCSILGAGLFGLLRLKKWGWAIVTAGCVLLSSSYLFYFTKMHQAASLVQGIFVLLFFLYLIRPETRERLL